MPGGFQIGQDAAAFLDVGTTLSSTTGTLLTAGASNVKGAWTALVSALPYDCDALSIELNGTSAVGLLDIAIGPSGSEMVLFSNVGYSCGGTSGVKFPLLPVSLPAGTRIAARIASATASQTVTIQLGVMAATANQPTGYAGGDGIGALTASSAGTTITSSATANAKGSFSTLVAAGGGSVTLRDYAALLVVICYSSTISMLTDIAIGASGSEMILIPNILTVSPIILHVPVAIPKGTRLSARLQSTSASQTTRTNIVGLY